MTSKLLLISILNFFIAACASQPKTPDLPTQLSNHLTQVANSYENADSLWQQILDGEPPVSCTLRLAVPEPFDLTVEQASQYPQSVVVRDHLNNAISVLEEIKRLWETECQEPSATISLSTIRLAVGLLDDAQNELQAANDAWFAWQS